MIEPQRAHQSEVQLLPKTPQLPRAKRTGWNTPATPFPQPSSLQPVPPSWLQAAEGELGPAGSAFCDTGREKEDPRLPWYSILRSMKEFMPSWGRSGKPLGGAGPFKTPSLK